MSFSQHSIKVLVFSQTKSSRTYVGRLWRENGEFCFEYDYVYLRKPNSLSLGVEMPLKPGLLKSKKFFPSLRDRIPEKNNPAYVDYCREWGISVDEDDQLVLISTIGHRGPSSFLFRREVELVFDGRRLNKFRSDLGLTIREFAQFLDTSAGTVSKTESEKLISKWLLMYCEILEKFPQVLILQLDRRGMYLHDDKIESVKSYIRRGSE